MIKVYHSLLAKTYKEAGEELPKNQDIKNDKYKDKILRELDCKVIEFMHDQILNEVSKDIKTTGTSKYKLFDSVRGMFTEGGPAFEGAGIFEKTHVQICIRNLNCIQGFFLPRKETDFLKSILPKGTSKGHDKSTSRKKSAPNQEGDATQNMDALVRFCPEFLLTFVPKIKKLEFKSSKLVSGLSV